MYYRIFNVCIPNETSGVSRIDLGNYDLRNPLFSYKTLIFLKMT